VPALAECSVSQVRSRLARSAAISAGRNRQRPHNGHGSDGEMRRWHSAELLTRRVVAQRGMHCAPHLGKRGISAKLIFPPLLAVKQELIAIPRKILAGCWRRRQIEPYCRLCLIPCTASTSRMKSALGSKHLGERILPLDATWRRRDKSGKKQHYCPPNFVNNCPLSCCEVGWTAFTMHESQVRKRQSSPKYCPRPRKRT